jgi:DNA-binding MurR/RpiR family transcriptional regulator
MMVIQKLKGIYNSLSASEKKVANYIIERPGDVIHYSITELAHWSEVSETTVYRLIKKIDYTGYQDFKISLVKQLSSPEINPEEGEEDIFSDVYTKTKNMLEYTYKNIDKEKINIVAEKIKKAKKVLFYAVGRSYSVALDMSLKLAALGISSEAYSDPHMQVMAGAAVNKDSLVISISHSGMIRDVYKSTEVAKNAGAFAVSITSGVNSPLSKIADLKIYTAANHPDENEHTYNRITEMFILDIIYRVLVQKMKPEKHFEKLNEITNTKRF